MKMSLLNTILKLKLFLITMTVILAGVIILMSMQYLSHPSIITILNIVELLLSIILPFVIGYFYNIYHEQKSAVDELSKIVLTLWQEAKELESKAFDEEYFKNKTTNSDIHKKSKCYQKEVSMLYILGIYFDNIKWYEHQMYKLPINFKEQIQEICNAYLNIDPLMNRYTYVSLDFFIDSYYVPYHYTYHNTNEPLKKFFKLLLVNSSKKYKSSLNEIIEYLNKIKIEEYYFNGEKCYT